MAFSLIVLYTDQPDNLTKFEDYTCVNPNRDCIPWTVAEGFKFWLLVSTC